MCRFDSVPTGNLVRSIIYIVPQSEALAQSGRRRLRRSGSDSFGTKSVNRLKSGSKIKIKYSAYPNWTSMIMYFGTGLVRHMTISHIMK